MRDHEQVPSVIQQRARVSDDMPVRAILSWEQIARPRIVTARGEGAAHRP
jgi:hypothetical protein